MPEVIGRFAPQAFALLRIVSGLMFMLHGVQKILGWPASDKMPHPLPMILLVGGWIELVGGFLILIGLFAGIVAFLCSGEMAVAYWMGHVARSHEMHPIVNQGELAALYCFVFLFIAAHGAGIWSVDGILRKRTPIVTS